MRAVFDCMVFIQALSNTAGSSAECLRAAEVGSIVLLVSNATLLELEDLLQRESLRGNVIHCSDATIRAYLSRIVDVAHKVNSVPMAWSLYRDPKDEKYLNLAIAANAQFIVTRDKHLLGLMVADDANAIAFRTTYPRIEILLPEPFLARLP